MRIPLPVRAWSSLVLVAVLSAGCGDDDSTTEPDPTTVADLAGTWTASSQVFSTEANGGQSMNVTALGAETRITVLSDGRARTWFTWGELYDEWDAQLSISGNTITSTPAESSRPTRTFEFTLTGNTMVLTDESSEFDFTLTGESFEPAVEEITLVRQ